MIHLFFNRNKSFFDIFFIYSKYIIVKNNSIGIVIYDNAYEYNVNTNNIPANK